jgi:hypothetical protein
MSELRLITQKEPWPELIAELERLTELARKGELIAFAGMWEYTTGQTGYAVFHNTSSSPLKMVGELEVMQQEVIQRKCTGQR